MKDLQLAEYFVVSSQERVGYEWKKTRTFCRSMITVIGYLYCQLVTTVAFFGNFVRWIKIIPLLFNLWSNSIIIYIMDTLYLRYIFILAVVGEFFALSIEDIVQDEFTWIRWCFSGSILHNIACYTCSHFFANGKGSQMFYYKCTFTCQPFGILLTDTECGCQRFCPTKRTVNTYL